MKINLIIIFIAALFRVSSAQNNAPSSTLSQETGTATAGQNNRSGTDMSEVPGSRSSGQIAIVDYKTVYEEPTLEDEVKLATERYSLSQSQQEVWLTAGKERREAEKQARALLEQKTTSYDKAPVFKGLREAHTRFYETIMGYLSPAQKQAVEDDRLIEQERQRRLAKIAPPPPVIVDTLPKVDSTAIKEAQLKELQKNKGKKAKKKA